MCGRRGSGRRPWAGACDEAIQSQGKPSCPDLIRASVAGKFFAKRMDERVKPAYDNHGSRTHASVPATPLRPSHAGDIRVLERRGRGECRVRRLHPRSRVRKKKAHERSHHRYAGAARHSLRDGFNGFLRTLPGDRAFLPPSLTDHHPVSLISASGYQDHTTSPSATGRLRLVRRPRPSHPAPNVRDDRETPLFIGHRTTQLYCCFYQMKKRKIFRLGTGQEGKSAAAMISLPASWFETVPRTSSP